MKYRLTYGRTVLLEKLIEADSADEAYTIAGKQDDSGLLDVSAKALDPDSHIFDIISDDDIWDLLEETGW